MKKFLSFHGKTSQENYWKTIIFLVVVAFVVTLIERPFTYHRLTTGNTTLDTSLILLWIPVLWLWVATSRRRLRDANHNPWWLLCLPVPFLNLVAIITLGCLPAKNPPSQKNKKKP